MMELNENSQKLYDLLYTTDFNAEELKRSLDSGKFSVEDVNTAALHYVCECNGGGRLSDEEYDRFDFGETIPGLESSHLLEAIRILLDYGLDPNMIYDGYWNIMNDVRFVSNGYQAADALALMFERGGDPSIIINEESLIRGLNTDLLYFLGRDIDSNYRIDEFVHCWMVFDGYGAKLENGKDIIDPCGDFDVSKLRDHRQYYYGMIHSDRSNDGMEVCFFDKDTNWEVARY